MELIISNPVIPAIIFRVYQSQYTQCYWDSQIEQIMYGEVKETDACFAFKSFKHRMLYLCRFQEIFPTRNRE
ncbi:hypothetical protein GCM10026987_30970 [Belliella aquatica]|uniref:Uncharacterized protein n=1 Tax=Belliella aquatica TaxID=1323734 RepID=A0ABQ1MIA8_9BACT|nr:hypothetical protein GCM10010993_17770 [Belliella aquatica]